ncbi:PREDICTED: U2 small nuclear ribonucleoprotein auxiliary factor 35 kDa subunit-related protein 2 [Vollenhovia emeryi]|uniref:U2 small nuclear ribonucleoprotein auxiliary factor 35 kDa subunit-related protein 2 n=1 Tax=Vollenhovia emeryi TaxID=411798 RepID=UPI0005F4EC05|nr:PREDICTED: U2 small nuclear ribonucleoprotein auxiliary factor 35 kDa subunit-related protein 2 [Vollenhovia emeryi]XP_011866152.1 PREDICTED: U2 small nuclear ribonucleoprotein auxiliary factor 35 kDa subunit-related protein 2 [Vollenhovia emeryi]
MEERGSIKPTHREWRRIARKERRRRIRRLAAQERDANEGRLKAALENNMVYLKFCAEEQKQKEEREEQEQKEHAERERLWLEEEITAQKKWQILEEQRAKEEQERREKEMKIHEEFEAIRAVLLKKKEEEKKEREEQLRKQVQLLKEIDNYIDNGVKTPEALREVSDNQPTKDLCPFFSKTGACRHGNACSKNHHKIFLSKVILIPGFYSHFSLEKNLAEYDTDVALEFENAEMLRHYHEFFQDVIGELESFGRIKTFKCCCNMEIHLRGNVYIEYYTERDAARAWRSLSGRWYGGKQLNCDFVHMISWRKAICGIAECPKGSKFCNFLHTFKNPHNRYNVKYTLRENKIKQMRKKQLRESSNNERSEERSKSKWEESDRDSEKDRNWRWSESPEIELNRTKDSETGQPPSKKRKQSDRLSSDHKQRKDVKLRSSKFKMLPKRKHHQPDRKRAHDNEDRTKEESASYPSKKRKKRSRKKHRKKSLEENSKKSEET